MFVGSSGGDERARRNMPMRQRLCRRAGAAAALLFLIVAGCGSQEPAPAPPAAAVPPTAAVDKVELGYWDRREADLHPDGFTVRSGLGEMWPAFDTAVEHYAVRCLVDGHLALTLHASALRDVGGSDAPADPEVVVNGDGGDAAGPVRRFRNGADDQDLAIVVERDGDRARYTVHCLPADFPDVATRGVRPSDDVLYAVRPVIGRRLRGSEGWPAWSYLALVDRNGVPRWQRRSDHATSLFKVHPAEDARAVWSEKMGLTDDPYNTGRWVLGNYRIVLAGPDYRERSSARTVGLRNTDAHDFNVTAEGNYILLAYEPGLRDLSAYGDYSDREPVHDSVVQMVSPDGEVLFHWNSWGNVPVRDCMAHRFPQDYAHVNSAVMVDGDVLVSLRGCHRVMLLDGETGETVWSVGETALDDGEYARLGLTPPLRVTGDPLGRFCGQHSAHLLDGNRLLMFDNQSQCPSGEQFGPYSRVVEYRIDPAAGEARHVREYSMFDSRSVVTGTLGSVAPLDNGNWLVGWGRNTSGLNRDAYGRPLSSLTEVDPETGEVQADIRFTYQGLPSHIPVKPWPATVDALPSQ